MLHDAVDDPGSLSPEELRERYESELRETVAALGTDAVAERSGVDAATVETLSEGDVPDLALEDAAAILAAREGAPDADTVAAQARDALLLGMTSAVLDVEAVESGLDGRLEAKEIQQKVEGRHPMTLAEYALLRQFVASRSP